MLHLYDSALHLPETEPEAADLLPDINHARWQAVRYHVARRLARDYYWVVFEPLEESKPEPVGGSLSDDLADIWRDLKRGITDDQSTPVIDAVWHLRFSFETHWGRHAVGAIAALHALCFGEFADPSRPQLRPIGQ